MKENDGLRRIMSNVVPPAKKTNALVASMWKGAMANGCVCIIELYEKE